MGNRLRNRFVRTITPFIFALGVIMHGVLYFSEYRGEIYWILGEITGHSIFALLYILATSRRMCRWYKLTVRLLLIPHLFNLAYIFGFGKYEDIVYASIIFSFVALVSYIIYAFSATIAKITTDSGRRD